MGKILQNITIYYNEKWHCNNVICCNSTILQLLQLLQRFSFQKNQKIFLPTGIQKAPGITAEGLLIE